MTEYWLSICIATYNRGKSIYDKVQTLLTLEIPGVQIVVSDNASTDDTVSWLKSIKDSRFKLVLNKQNMGPTYNYVNALKQGDGEYLLFMTDKDTMNPNFLLQLKDLVETNKLSTGYVALNCGLSENRINVWERGKTALIHAAYLSKHPTGYFYKREFFKKIDDIARFETVDTVGYFPFEFLCAELCCMGSAGEVKLPLFTTAKLESRGEKSLTYSADDSNLFFDPKNRYELMAKCMRHLNTLPLKDKEYEQIRRVLYKRYWFLAVTMYPEYKKNKLLCEHYNMERKELSGSERIAIAKEFKDKYAQEFGTDKSYKIWSVYQICKLRVKCLIKKI